MKTHKNTLEWIVFAVSAVLIAAVTVMLLTKGARSNEQPPSLAITTGDAERAGDVWRVPVQVRNDGDATAEQALIEIELVANGNAVERAELTFAFVPKHSTRSGWVTFQRDPRCCALRTRAAFNEP